MKTLLLARHAKSSWDQPGVDDFDRVLNDRGVNDAPNMADFLQQCGYPINRIISSDAVRALQTAEEYRKLLTPETKVSRQHKLYQATYSDILTVIKSIPESDEMVMLVGHNPGMNDVLNYLIRSEVDDMPTCSVAIIQFDVAGWDEIKINSGNLLAFEYPKKHDE